MERYCHSDSVLDYVGFFYFFFPGDLFEEICPHSDNRKCHSRQILDHFIDGLNKIVGSQCLSNVGFQHIQPLCISIGMARACMLYLFNQPS